jgi:hypothetical protein
MVTLTLMGCTFLVGCGDEGTDKTTEAVCTELPPLAQKDTDKVGVAQLWEDRGPWRELSGPQGAIPTGTSPSPAVCDN